MITKKGHQQNQLQWYKLLKVVKHNEYQRGQTRYDTFMLKGKYMSWKEIILYFCGSTKEC